MSKQLVKFRPPPGVVLMPDNGPYKLCLKVPSSDGSRYYKVAFLSGPNSNYFVCSCPGGISHGQCKHLTAMGLWGRKNRAQALQKARDIGLI